MVSGFFNNLKKFISTSSKRVLILGYANAGKSTIMEQMILRKILEPVRRETHGSKSSDIEISFDDKTHKFKATDVGGSELYQDIFWKAEIAKADGIIYVIDGSLLYECEGIDTMDKWDARESYCPNINLENSKIKCGCAKNETFRKSRIAKSYAFSILDTGKPILIFLNKLDLGTVQRIMSEEELINLYNLREERYNSKIANGSALTGENVFESIGWLFEQMG